MKSTWSTIVASLEQSFILRQKWDAYLQVLRTFWPVCKVVMSQYNEVWSIFGMMWTVQCTLSTHPKVSITLCLISRLMRYLRGLELSNLLLCITLRGLHLDTYSNFHRAQTCITDWGWNLGLDHQYNCSFKPWTLNNGANQMSSFY